MIRGAHNSVEIGVPLGIRRRRYAETALQLGELRRVDVAFCGVLLPRVGAASASGEFRLFRVIRRQLGDQRVEARKSAGMGGVVTRLNVIAVLVESVNRARFKGVEIGTFSGRQRGNDRRHILIPKRFHTRLPCDLVRAASRASKTRRRL